MREKIQLIFIFYKLLNLFIFSVASKYSYQTTLWITSHKNTKQGDDASQVNQVLKYRFQYNSNHRHSPSDWWHSGQKKGGVSKWQLVEGNRIRLPWLSNSWNKWFGNLLFEDIENSVKDPISQSILETKNFFKNRSVNMQRKIYRGHRKNLSFTIQGQIWINWKRQQLRIRWRFQQ